MNIKNQSVAPTKTWCVEIKMNLEDMDITKIKQGDKIAIIKRVDPKPFDALPEEEVVGQCEELGLTAVFLYPGENESFDQLDNIATREIEKIKALNANAVMVQTKWMPYAQKMMKELVGLGLPANIIWFTMSGTFTHMYIIEAQTIIFRPPVVEWYEVSRRRLHYDGIPAEECERPNLHLSW